MEKTNRILKRNEIAREDTWAIEDLYASDELWEQELATLEADKTYLQTFAGRLGESAETLCTYLLFEETLSQKISKLASYCMRMSDVDTRNATYQAMVGKFMSIMVAMGAVQSFETPEIMAISDETMEKFYQDSPALERFRRSLTYLRRRKAHTLSQAEEKILAAAGEMASAPHDIYGKFADADITFADAVDSNGEHHPLRQGTFVSYDESPDRVLRQSAYENLYDSFANYKNTAANLLDAQNKQLKFFAQMRKNDSAFEASLDRTNVPTSVYLNLIEAVHQNMDKMHRYVSLRKKLLGVEDLHFYDVYTPLLADVDKHITFAQTKQTVYDA